MLYTFLNFLSFLSGVVSAEAVTTVVAQEAGLADFLNSIGGLVTAFIAAAVPFIGIVYSASRFFKAKAVVWEPMVQTLFSEASTDIKKEVIADMHSELKDVKDAMAVLLAKAAVDTEANIENPTINAELTAGYEKVAAAINKVVVTTTAVEDTVQTIVAAVNEVKEVLTPAEEEKTDKKWFE